MPCADDCRCCHRVALGSLVDPRDEGSRRGWSAAAGRRSRRHGRRLCANVFFLPVLRRTPKPVPAIYAVSSRRSACGARQDREKFLSVNSLDAWPAGARSRPRGNRAGPPLRCFAHAGPRSHPPSRGHRPRGRATAPRRARRLHSAQPEFPRFAAAHDAFAGRARPRGASPAGTTAARTFPRHAPYSLSPPVVPGVRKCKAFVTGEAVDIARRATRHKRAKSTIGDVS